MCACLSVFAVAGLSQAGKAPLKPAVVTQPVTDDADDPAIWRNPADPGKSLILGTNKAGAPKGALVAFDMAGNVVQIVPGIDRPNNVDVEYGLPFAGKSVDIAVVTERYKNRLRIFSIDPTNGNLADISGDTQVFRGAKKEAAACMGVALYRRPKDGAIFAVVSRKEGPSGKYLHQYRLMDDGKGKVKAVKVREFGKFSGKGEIEAVAVDDVMGYIYYADEGDGVAKYAADPNTPNANRELGRFAKEKYKGDREGIAIIPIGMKTGYILSIDQIKGGSVIHVYKREGEKGKPHNQSKPLATVRLTADETDGLEATSASLGSGFPHGAVIAMNSKGKNFHLYRWEDVAAVGNLRIK